MGQLNKIHQAQKEIATSKTEEFWAEYEKLCLRYGYKMAVIPKFTPIMQVAKLSEDESNNLTKKYANIT